MIIRCLPELTKEAIIDNTWQLSVFKERDFVDELKVLACLLGTVPSHSHIRENCPEVGLNDFVQKFSVHRLVEVLDEDDFVGALRCTIP